jgi:hypothetical protein
MVTARSKMNLIYIYGPPASGKLAIATELSKLTGYKLFHNHIAIDFVKSVFEFGTESFWKLVDEYRLQMLEQASKEGISVIFTHVYVRGINEPFLKSLIKRVEQKNGGKIYFVRLQCEKKILLKRIRFASRRKRGKMHSVRKLEWYLRSFDSNSEIPNTGSLTINTASKTPLESARRIMKNFDISSVNTEGD